MRTLFESLGKHRGDAELVAEFDIKTPSNLIDTEALFNTYAKETVQNKLVECLKKWFDANPRRRNISMRALIAQTWFLGPNDKTFIDVAEEMQRIGVMDIDLYELKNKERGIGGFYGFVDGAMTVSCGTSKQYKEGAYNIKTVGIRSFDISKKTRYSNAYNHLSAEDQNIILEKLAQCRTGVKCKIELIEYPVDYTKSLCDPIRVGIVFECVYDNSKLKKLLKELKEDKRLQRFADSMDSVSKGIQDYYAEKRSRGDRYVGD